MVAAGTRCAPSAFLVESFVNMDSSNNPALHPLSPAAEVARVLGNRLRAAIKGRDEVIKLILRLPRLREDDARQGARRID